MASYFIMTKHILTLLADRFWSKVDINAPNGCWNWTGARNNANGYGVLGGGRRRAGIVYAHRLSYELHFGIKPPPGRKIVVMHTCDNPICVNPDHLRLGSARDNTTDSWLKGRLQNYPRIIASPDMVKMIRRRLAEGMTIRGLARETGISRNVIGDIKRGWTWRHI